VRSSTTSLSTTSTRGLDRLIRVPDHHSGVIPERWRRRRKRVPSSTGKYPTDGGCRAVGQTGVVDQLSSELLGFAAEARVLIVNCDDFGMHDAVNAAVVESIENGIASSCSLMVPCPAAADAMQLLRERPHIAFGIHLALIRDLPEYRWGPAADKADVPSLLDPDTNELYVDTPVQRAALLAKAKLSDVERELRAQIDVVVEAGLAATHLDWHCLADGGRADIFDLAMALAKEYGLAARVWLDEGRRKAREQGKPVVDNAFLDSFSISLVDKAATYERMLRDLPFGLTEWAVHPARGTGEWQTIEPTGGRVRQTDHAFLTSPQAREILDHEGISVIDYRPLQQAWNA
jgi:chitin disaccharide deacetylase